MILDKINYRMVYNRKNTLNKDGMALVQLEARLQGKRRYFSTHVYLTPEQWKNGIVVNHPHASDLNALLLQARMNAEAIEIGLWKRGITPTLSLVKDAVTHDEKPDMTFTEFSEKVVREDTQRKKGTKEVLMNSIQTMRKFRRLITFQDLTPDFVNDYQKWLREEYKCAENTVIKHIRCLKTLINEAIKRRYIKHDDYPFLNIKVKRMSRKTTYLTDDEVRRLELHSQKKRIRHRDTLIAFLFLIYTGLRISDLRDLKREHIDEPKKGKVWLRKTTVKTKTDVKIPLWLMFDGKALDVLRKVGVDRLRNTGHSSTFNRKLTEIMADVGIRKKVSAHVARHTTATLLLQKGVPATSIQKLLGHSDLETTMIYADAVDDTLVKDLERVQKRRKIPKDATNNITIPVTENHCLE